MVKRIQSTLIFGVGIALTLLLILPIIGFEWGTLASSEKALTKGYVLDVYRAGTFDGTYSRMKSWNVNPRLYPDGVELPSPLYVYAVGVMSVGLVGQSAFWLLPMILSGALVYLLYRLSTEILRALARDTSITMVIPVWLAGFASVAPGWLSGFWPELLFTFLTVSGIYWAVRLYRTQAVSDAVLSIIAISFASVIQQDHLVLMSGLVLTVLFQAILLTSRVNLGRNILVFLALPILIIGSFYAALFVPTGMDLSLSPSGLEYSTIDSELNAVVEQSEIFDRPNAKSQQQYPSLKRMIETDSSFRSMYNQVNATLPMNIIGFISIIVAACLIWIWSRSAVWYLMAAMLLPYIFVWLLYTSDPLSLQMQFVLVMLAAMTCVGFIVPVLTGFQRQISVLLFSLLAIYGVMIPYIMDESDVGTRWGDSSEAKSNTKKALLNWIEQNTEEDARIFTFSQKEISAKTDRETVWDSRIWFVKDVQDTLRLWDKAYDVDYVVLHKSQVTPLASYHGSGDIPNTSTLYTLIQGTMLFVEVYQDQDFIIYSYNRIDKL